MWFVDGKKDAGLVALSHPFSSALTEVQRASRKAGIVLFSAGSCYIRPVRFGWFPSRSQVQVRAHIFLQSVNVIRNMDYLARCIKTEAHLLHRDVESISSVAQGLAFSKSMCFKKSHKVEKQMHPHT